MSEESGDFRLDGLLEGRLMPPEEALAQVFQHCRPRLERMVECRLDPQLRLRVSPGDVVQEVYLVARKQFPGFLQERKLPVYLWLRLIAGQKLIELHRFHAAKKRGIGIEERLEAGAMGDQSSAILTDQILKTSTTASQLVMREELKDKVKEAIDGLQPEDREILLLRYYERLSNVEAAQVLGVTEAAASQRHVRALKRLREVVEKVEGLKSTFL